MEIWLSCAVIVCVCVSAGINAMAKLYRDMMTENKVWNILQQFRVQCSCLCIFPEYYSIAAKLIFDRSIIFVLKSVRYILSAIIEWCTSTKSLLHFFLIFLLLLVLGSFNFKVSEFKWYYVPQSMKIGSLSPCFELFIPHL